MSFKPFFVHMMNAPGHLPKGMMRGATIFVSPSTEKNCVQVQVAVCSRKDAYCKRTGRDVAQASEAYQLNTRLLSQRLADLRNMIDGVLFTDTNRSRQADFNYVYKYML